MKFCLLYTSVKVAEHKDIEDDGQTVLITERIINIHTTATVSYTHLDVYKRQRENNTLWKIKNKVGIEFFSASDIISQVNGEKYGKNKLVKNEKRNRCV